MRKKYLWGETIVIQNVASKTDIKKTHTSSTPNFTQLKSKELTADTVSFSAKLKQSPSIHANELEISKRIKTFKKVMGDKPIPASVMKVLKNPKIKMSPPVNTNRSASVGLLRNSAKRLFEFALPKSISDKLIARITPKTMSDINVLSVRLNKLKITDISENPFDDTAEVYFISLINDGVTKPNLLNVETFEKIREGDDLFEKGLQRPYTVYLSEKGKVPRLLDFRLLIMEADKASSMKAAEIIEAITGDNDYKDIVEAIKELIKASGPPGAIFLLVDAAVGVIARVLKTNDDDKLLSYAARFTKDFDNLGVGTYDNKYDCVDLGYEIVAK